MNILKICLSVLVLLFLILAIIKDVKIYKYKKASKELNKSDELSLWVYINLYLIASTILCFI